MNIKQIEKASKLVNQIQELDKEIIEIDRIALLIANSETETSFTMSVKDLTPPEEENKVLFDEDGFLKAANGNIDAMRYLIGGPRLSFDPGRQCGYISNDNKDKSSLTAKLNPNTSLQILGALLADKTTKRNNLIKQIQKMGFQE